MRRGGLAGREAEIFGHLHDAIVEQRLPPGAKLTEDVLAEIYRVNRARIRRVMLALSAVFLVDIIPGRGAFVAAPSPELAREVFEARCLLEVGVLNTLRTPPDQAVMDDLQGIATAEMAAHHRRDRAEMIRLSAAFHVAIADRLGNGVIAQMLESLVARTSVIIAMYEASVGQCCLANDHQRLIQVIGNGQGDVAALYMGYHLSAIQAGLLLQAAPLGKPDIRAILATRSPPPQPAEQPGAALSSAF